MTTRKLIASFALLASGAALAAAEPQADARARADAFLEKEMARGELAKMSVAYEQHGETRYAFVRGADAEKPLHVASITKTVTAVLLLQLAEEGKLCLNDYVQDHIPLFPTNNVTILHLMTHTSGWRNRGGHTKKPGETERFYGTMFKEAEAGERFRYMSQGYDILAEIIERATGVDDVADVAKSRVFGPLGMTDTSLAPHQGQAGMMTTAPDLVKFGRALLDIRKNRQTGILTPESVDALFRPVLRSEFNRTPGFFKKSGDVGFGQYFSDLNTLEAMSHSGASGCNFLIDPGLDCVEVILTGTTDWNNMKWRSKDGNFARVNGMLIAAFGDHPAPPRPIASGSAKPDHVARLKRELQSLHSRRAAGEKVQHVIDRIERELKEFR